VRELENARLHAIAFRHGDVIGVESLPPQLHARGRSDGAPTHPRAIRRTCCR
jgi:hypothetical protein